MTAVHNNGHTYNGFFFVRHTSYLQARSVERVVGVIVIIIPIGIMVVAQLDLIPSQVTLILR